VLPLYTVISTGIEKETDPNQLKATKEVFERLTQIQQEVNPQEKSQRVTSTVGIVSVEQALKELRDLGQL